MWERFKLLPFLPVLVITGCYENGGMAVAEQPGQGTDTEAAVQCRARTDEFAPMRDERRVFPNPQDHEKLVIYRAIRCKNVDQVRTLLDGGLDPNTNLNGAGLSYWAAMAGSIPMLELLFERGAKMNGDEGSSIPGPLEGSMGDSFGTEDWSVYEFLLSRGADPEIRSGNPTFTIAERLTITGRFDRIDELLDRGFDRDLHMLRHLVQERVKVAPEEDKKRGLRLLERLDQKLRETPALR